MILRSEVKGNKIVIGGVSYEFAQEGAQFKFRESIEDYLIRAIDEALTLVKGRTEETHKLRTARAFLANFFGKRATALGTTGEVSREELDLAIQDLSRVIGLTETDEDLKPQTSGQSGRLYYHRGLAHFKRYMMLHSQEDLDLAMRDMAEASKHDPGIAPEADRVLEKIRGMKVNAVNIEDEYREYLKGRILALESSSAPDASQKKKELEAILSVRYDSEKGKQIFTYDYQTFLDFITEKEAQDSRYHHYLEVLKVYQAEADKTGEAVNERALDIKAKDEETFRGEIEAILKDEETLRKLGEAIRVQMTRRDAQVPRKLKDLEAMIVANGWDLSDPESVRQILELAKEDEQLLSVLLTDVIKRFGQKRTFRLAFKSYSEETRDSTDISGGIDSAMMLPDGRFNPNYGRPQSTANIYTWHLDWLAMMHGIDSAYVGRIIHSDMLEEFYAHSRPEVNLGFFHDADKIESDAEKGDPHSRAAVALAKELTYSELHEVLAALQQYGNQEIAAVQKQIAELEKKIKEAQEAGKMDDAKSLAEQLDKKEQELERVKIRGYQKAIQAAQPAVSDAEKRVAKLEKDLEAAKKAEDEQNISRLTQELAAAREEAKRLNVLQRA